jgi:benzoyl-CoA reductase/2-hydroxyglutaryl-CoA dehydratase subunit BcrC/BadD/HgdB
MQTFKGEYELIIKKLEHWTGKKITDSDLREGVEIMNKARQAMKKI